MSSFSDRVQRLIGFFFGCFCCFECSLWVLNLGLRSLWVCLGFFLWAGLVVPVYTFCVLRSTLRFLIKHIKKKKKKKKKRVQRFMVVILFK